MSRDPAPPAQAQVWRLPGQFSAALPLWPVLLLARLVMASVFWTSGRTKVDPGTWLTLSDTAVQLFRDEYRIAIVTPGITAWMAMLSEHLFPALLLLGLASRAAAGVLLGMTLVIEVFVYPDAYNVHGPWAVCLLLVMLRGAGLVSLDHLIARRA